MDEHDSAAAPDVPDDQIQSRLGRVAAEVDPVPYDLVQAVRATIGTRDLDAELAVLVGDSTDDGTMVASGFEAVRAAPAGVGSGRLLSFVGAGVQVDLEISRVGDQLDLVGQVVGALDQDCSLEQPQATRVVELDSLGRFLVSAVAGGPVRIRCRSARGAWVRTAWVTI